MSENPQPGRRPNALAKETSPYLLQHAHNPVDWLPWGEAAFERSRTRDLPILLSVGYSACHWCHVMERESFEDEGIAALMNEHFVPVKVDREERPDVDSVYMEAVQLVSGQGGWPMTVFLTPDGQPFYAGTYYPPEDRYGRPGFRRLLAALHDAWTHRRAEVLESAADLTAHLGRLGGLQASADPLDADLAFRALEALVTQSDRVNGGFGTAPKFPNPGVLEFLLQQHVRTGEPRALEVVEGALGGMARGGIRDHLGGGFARYSTDARWLVPHFEKMLYDNAQLARLYLHAHQVTGKGEHADVARETLDFMLSELASPEGGFYSALDADSEGVEGKFYVWSAAEVREALGEDAALFSRAYGVTEGGNWEGHTVLERRQESPELAAEFGLSVEEVEAWLDAARATLLQVRSRRVPPGRDDKVIVAWNGLALAALAEGGRVLGEERYLEAARRNVEFVRRELYRDGRLLHTYKDGQARVHGMLDDLGLYGLGLLELYRSIFERSHLDLALELAEAALAFYRDPAGGFFDTPSDAEALVVRPKGLFDAAMPSGNGAIAQLLQGLGHLTGRFEWETVTLEPLALVREAVTRQPTGFGSLLGALEGHLAPRREVAVVGDLGGEAGQALLGELHRRYLPHVALAAGRPGEAYLPVLEGREPPEGTEVAAYVCENLACRLPVTTAADLAAALTPQPPLPRVEGETLLVRNPLLAGEGGGEAAG